VTQDQWVFNKKNCTYSKKYGSTDPNENKGSKTCIEIAQFTTGEVSSRYTPMTGCDGTVKTNLDSFFGQLKNYDVSRRSMFQPIKKSLNTLKSDNDAYI
jgi:hypothetical protein